MTGSSPSPLRGKRRCIIHGHFYQPPREDPWLGGIARQPSAAPAHDWNERIAEECYRPNAYSRILDPNGMIRGIYNNYQQLSFNFGPTLWIWLEKHYPDVCERIIDADAQSCRRLGGHGNALAQVYNHLILPLASRRDQTTQVRWARQFFADRFGREPEGIWLAETAINNTTACTLVDEGIRFVVLSPTQAQRYRPLEGEGEWCENTGNTIPTLHPYRLFPHGPGETPLDVFFFNEPLSRAVSFEGVLTDASLLAQHIEHSFDDQTPATDQCVMIATDGETFGHHKPFADMCLAWFFAALAPARTLEVVNFGYLLEHAPPRWEVELRNGRGEGTAWSCAHGTGRWIRDCGCSTGGRAGWNQKWRTPLRLALDSCQAIVDRHFEQELGALGVDPWEARNAYIPHGESCATAGAFTRFCATLLRRGNPARLDSAACTRIRRLLEVQKYLQFSYTSCGWFFSDISGIETVQNLACVGRALHLLGEGEVRDRAVDALCTHLAKAVGNLPGVSGQTLFATHVLPWWEDRERLCFAAALLFVHTRGDCWRAGEGCSGIETGIVESVVRTVRQSEHTLCRVRFCRELTGESGVFDVLVVRDRTGFLFGYVRPVDEAVAAQPLRHHRHAIMGWTSEKRLLLGDLFDASRAELSRVIQTALTPAMMRGATAIVQEHGCGMDTLAALQHPPNTFVAAALQAALTVEFNRTMARLKNARSSLEEITARLRSLHDQACGLGITMSREYSQQLLEQLLVRQLETFARTLDVEQCERMRYLLNIVDRLGIALRKNHLEDRFYAILEGPIRTLYEHYQEGTISTHDREVLIRAIGFARRMNFATESFPLQTG